MLDLMMWNDLLENRARAIAKEHVLGVTPSISAMTSRRGSLFAVV